MAKKFRYIKHEGFTAIPNEVLESDKLDGLEKLVLVVVAKFSPNAFPAVSTIARLCGLSDRHVQRKLRSLSKKNILLTRFRSGKSSVYVPYWLVDNSHFRVDNSGEGVTISHPTPDYRSPPGVTNSYPNNTPLNHNHLTKNEPVHFSNVLEGIRRRVRRE